MAHHVVIVLLSARTTRLEEDISSTGGYAFIYKKGPSVHGCPGKGLSLEQDLGCELHNFQASMS